MKSAARKYVVQLGALVLLVAGAFVLVVLEHGTLPAVPLLMGWAAGLLVAWRLFGWAPTWWLGCTLQILAVRWRDQRIWHLGQVSVAVAADHPLYQLLSAAVNPSPPRAYQARCPKCRALVQQFVPQPEAEQLDGQSIQCPRCGHRGSYRLTNEPPSKHAREASQD